MIDIHDVRARPEEYQKACSDKRIAFDIAQFLILDGDYRELRSRVETKRAEQIGRAHV